MTSCTRPHPLSLSLLLFALFSQLPLVHAAQTDIPGPSGGRFGTTVTFLPNGNFVVVDPFYDFGVWTDSGAVYLYSGTNPTGPPLTTLYGIDDHEHVGSGGITVLSNGNFVIFSPDHDDASNDAGAVTWCNGTAAAGTVFVTAANSLVGGSTGDFATGYTKVVALKNGHYLVAATGWDNSSTPATDAGAVVWRDGTTGSGALISSSNALVGTTASDSVGLSVKELTNGHYVVCSYNWSGTKGAVTWCSGTSATAGEVSATNSLVGSTAGDFIGGSEAILLANGNYVVAANRWDSTSPPLVNAGAVSWGNGSGGTVGVVSSSNSLVGSTSGEGLGGSGVIVLTNGHYVVPSPSWSNPSPVTAGVGAVTWCDGTTGRTGNVSAANSLIGTTANDNVGGTNGVIPLTNGHYVVRSTQWDNTPSAMNAGAVTWCNGATGRTGTVSTSNSLFGTRADNNVGSGGITALTNGHYVVSSPNWDLPLNLKTDLGAVTWGNGTTGITGAVSAANSLVGNSNNDRVGSSGVTALTNGNYVVRSPSWDNPSPFVGDAGAVTWANGATGLTGIVSVTNSLIGASTSDNVGSGSITALTNGNYLVVCSGWDQPAPPLTQVGAVTWGNGTTGIAGVVSAANSLVGSSAGDLVGNGDVKALANGSFVVGSPNWNNPSPATADAGAVTWGSGTAPLTGPLSAANSFIGSTANDQVGVSGTITALSNGHYLVRNSDWDDGATANVGAVTLGNGTTGTFGTVTTNNSVLGTLASQGFTLVFSYSAPGGRLLVGHPSASKVTLFGSPTTSIVIGGTYFTVNEEVPGGMLSIPITRLGGTEDEVSVRLSTSSTGGTATGGTGLTGDYTTITNQLVDFAVGEATRYVDVTILNDTTANEPNETFKVILSPVVGSGVIGTPSTATVRIIDNDTLDVTAPVNAPVISTPAANSVIGVNAGATMTVTGTASDDKGISLVEIQLNGGTWAPATLTSITGTSAAWSATIAPLGGINSVKARSWDTRGLQSPDSAARSFKVARPLIVRIVGGGSVTNAPLANSFYELGRSYTLAAVASATPAPGFLFAGWSVNGGADVITQMNIASNALDKNSLTFLFREGLQLTANFAANPYSSFVTGDYNGLIQPSPTLPDRAPVLSDSGEDGSVSSNTTQGLFTGNILSTGGFSGKLTIDGLVLNVAGAFDHLGRARFGTSRATSLMVTRTGKPSLEVSLTSDRASSITGTITIRSFQQSIVEAVCTLDATRAYYNGTALIPFNFVGPAPGYATHTFTVIMPPVPPFEGITGTFNAGAETFDPGVPNAFVNGDIVVFRELGTRPDISEDVLYTVINKGVATATSFQLQGNSGTVDLTTAGTGTAVRNPQDLQTEGYPTLDYPQGHGFGTITVTKAGLVTFSGTLADGTPVGASSKLSLDDEAPLFAPLYNKLGFFSVQTSFSAQSGSDILPVSGTRVLWNRPRQTTSHYYPAGWPEGITTDLLGAVYLQATDPKSMVKAPGGGDLQDPDEDGNVSLVINSSQWIEPLTKAANIAKVGTNDVVTKVPDNDPTFTLKITRASGAISGTFTHLDDTGPEFKGILYPRGPRAGGYGHFLTKQPNPIDYTGESGNILLIGEPEGP